MMASSLLLKSFRASVFSGVAALTLATASAQTAYTVPEGYVTVTIAGSSNGTTYNLTPFSAPLHPTASITGQATGRITGVTSNTISNSSGGWQNPNGLSQVGSPYFVIIKSGTAVGRMFHITANTATTLTVNNSGLDLSTLITAGSSGDTYEIVPGDTLLGLLGTPADGIIGGTSSQFSANTIDKVLINDPNNNTAFTYYYDTTASQWRRLGSGVNQGNLVVSPKAGLQYSRISTTPLTFTFLGRVPSVGSKVQLAALGTTLLAPYYPKDTTLSSLGFQNISGWRKNGDPGIDTSNCDQVVLKVGATIFSYYYDVTLSQWRRLGSGVNQNNVAVAAGTGIRVIRKGTSGQFHTWEQTLPYSLN
jgi:uncharacterized protein (TIGR02597 family)